MAGFYIPPELLTRDDFKKAAAAFVSPDGHAVRYLIQTKLNPFSIEAMDQVDEVTDTARGAQPNTALADASISMAGFTATLRDMRDYYNHDIRLIIVMTVIVVLLSDRPVARHRRTALSDRQRRIHQPPTRIHR